MMNSKTKQQLDKISWYRHYADKLSWLKFYLPYPLSTLRNYFNTRTKIDCMNCWFCDWHGGLQHGPSNHAYKFSNRVNRENSICWNLKCIWWIWCVHPNIDVFKFADIMMDQIEFNESNKYKSFNANSSIPQYIIILQKFTQAKVIDHTIKSISMPYQISACQLILFIKL